MVGNICDSDETKIVVFVCDLILWSLFDVFLQEGLSLKVHVGIMKDNNDSDCCDCAIIGMDH